MSPKTKVATPAKGTPTMATRSSHQMNTSSPIPGLNIPIGERTTNPEQHSHDELTQAHRKRKREGETDDEFAKRATSGEATEHDTHQEDMMKVDDEGGPMGISVPTIPLNADHTAPTSAPDTRDEATKPLGGLKDSIYAPTTLKVPRTHEAQTDAEVEEVLKAMRFQKNKPAPQPVPQRDDIEEDNGNNKDAVETSRPLPPRPFTLIEKRVPIHFDSMVGPAVGMPESQVQEFLALRGVFFTVWGLKVHEKGAQEAKLQTETGVHAVTGEQIILTPGIRSADARPREGPIAYYTSKLSETARKTLLEQGCWSMRTPQVTFFVHEAKVIYPRWICGLEGFWDYRDVKALRAGIVHLLTTDKKATAEFRSVMREILESESSNLRTTDLDEGIAATVSTLEITVLEERTPGNIEDFKLNMYVDSPTRDSTYYMRYRQSLRDIKYYVAGLGAAKQWYPPPCSGCHGADHPRGLCPFLTIPGWNGKPSEREKKYEERQGSSSGSNNRRYETYDDYEDRYPSRGGRGNYRGGRDEERTRRMNDDRERRRDRDDAYDRQGRWRGRASQSRYD